MWLMILFYNSINQKLPPKGVSGAEHINYIFKGPNCHTFVLYGPNSTI